MSLPASYSAFRRTIGDVPRTIEPSTETLPTDLSSQDVLIKIHAVSLNFRDVAMLNGRYPVEVQERGIPASDCAAEVVKAGSDVKDFSVGDRVSVIFDLGNHTGHDDTPTQALGGDVSGVLRQYAVYEQKHLVKIPDYLSWEEGSTLACAGVTAWNALDSLPEPRRKGSALFQGTGGVSMFAALLCNAAGMQSIITSSSDAKIEQVKKLGRIDGINYKTTTDQVAEVKRLTSGRGVDFVINNTGPASIPDDISVLCPRGGTVSLVGFLAGFDAQWPPAAALMALMIKTAKLKAIGVGSKKDFEDMNRFLEEHKVSLTPLIDRVFSFDESKEAFDYLYSGSHTGKVVIKL